MVWVGICSDQLITMSAATSAPESQLWDQEALVKKVDSLLCSNGHRFRHCKETYAFIC